MILLRFFVAVFVILTLYASNNNIAKADSYNLAPNSSFEEGSTSPSDWQTFEEPICSNVTQDIPLNTNWDNNVSFSGTKSISINNISWSNRGGMPGGWTTSDFIPIANTPNDYFIQVRVLGQNALNLRGALAICFFNSNSQLIKTEVASTDIRENNSWGTITHYFQIEDDNTTKIKIIFHAACQTNSPCSGSLWYDDIEIKPRATILAHTFEDLDRDGAYDFNELSLPYWGVNFYIGSNCSVNNPAFTGAATNQNGLLFYKNVVGEYSLRQTFIRVEFGPPLRFPDVRTEGWTNTTPICQNVTLRDGETPVVHFGNIRSPNAPYFSQKDPVWASNEYDHGNTQGPFFCGTTIAGCGCAITSSAMLLKFHGATKSPNGQDTNPQTLNNWLKENNGYAFGALKWNSVASYSVKANGAFGTQKIKFTGVGPANNFTNLDAELSSQKPTVLQEPGHFILATAKQGANYTINDPAWENKKSLTDYGNTFLSTRKFEKTNTDLSSIYLSTPSPNHLFVVDQEGRRAGKDPQTGDIYTEIPNSYYFLEPSLLNQSQENPQLPPPDTGVNTLVIINPETEILNIQSTGGQNYPIDFSVYDENGEISTKLIENLNGEQNFNLSFSPDPGSVIDVTQLVEIDIKPGSSTNQINLHNNGVIPVAILSTSTFDSSTIDPQSIKFGPNSAQENHLKGHREDIDSDGDVDLVLHLNTQDSGLSPPQTEACITGQTLDGVQIVGCDLIHILS